MANIKLVLIQDVENLGRSGDLVSVKPGYARNFLIPQKCALVADANSLRLQARLQDDRVKKAVQDRKDSEELAKRFEGLSVATTVKVDAEGHMYGSVTAHDIVKLIQEQVGLTIEKRNVNIAHPIREVGDHNIDIRLKEGVQTSCMLKIAAEEGTGPTFA